MKRKSPLFSRLFIDWLTELVEVLNKFTAEGRLRERTTITAGDLWRVSRLAGVNTGVEQRDAVEVGGDLNQWGRVEVGESPDRQPRFLFLGRKRRLTLAETQDADKTRLLKGEVDSPASILSHQEKVNALHSRIASTTPIASRRARLLWGKRRKFTPRGPGEPTEEVKSLLRSMATRLRTLPANRLAECGLAVCENPLCKKLFILTRKDKRRCSSRCAMQQRGREANRKRRAVERSKETKLRLRRILSAVRQCPKSTVDRKAWVSREAKVSKTWLTQAVNRGYLHSDLSPVSSVLTGQG
jgi:hypothetical protein